MTYREPDSDIIGRIESKRLEPPEFDEAPSFDIYSHEYDCPLRRCPEGFDEQDSWTNESHRKAHEFLAQQEATK